MPGFADGWGTQPTYGTGFGMGTGPFAAPATAGWGGMGSYGTGMGTASPTGTMPNLGISSPKLGLNFDTANLALSGLSTIGNLWAAFQAQKLAREQFKYTKAVTDTNLTNQIKTYNTGLTDRANNRAIVEGRDANYTKAYIDANQLSRYGS